MADITLVNGSLKISITQETFLPLGGLYVASALESEGYSVDFRDYQMADCAEPLLPGNFVDFVRDSADIIGISSMHNMLPFLMGALERLKQEMPQKTILLGGPGPTGVAESLMQAFPQVDIIVRGEGEQSTIELLEALQKSGGSGSDTGNLEGIHGITCRSGGKVISTPARPRVENLDQQPFPAYHLINISDYVNTSVITSRGCPYPCTFCDVAPLWNRRTKYRSVDSVIEEIRLLHDKYGQKDVHLLDDTFVLQKSRVREFCDKVKKEIGDINWSCCGRVNLMDDQLLQTMRDAGCLGMFLGIESGSDRVLTDIKKKFTSAQAAAMMKKAVKYFDVKTSFIYGFPTETIQDFHETLLLTAFASKVGTKYQHNLLAPLPLTDIYEQYKDRLIFNIERSSSMVSSGYRDVVDGSYKVYEDILDVVRRHPGIFSGFYQVPSPDMAEKHRLLDELGITGMTLSVD